MSDRRSATLELSAPNGKPKQPIPVAKLAPPIQNRQLTNTSPSANDNQRLMLWAFIGITAFVLLVTAGGLAIAGYFHSAKTQPEQQVMKIHSAAEAKLKEIKDQYQKAGRSLSKEEERSILQGFIAEQEAIIAQNRAEELRDSQVNAGHAKFMAFKKECEQKGWHMNGGEDIAIRSMFIGMETKEDNALNGLQYWEGAIRPEWRDRVGSRYPQLKK